MHIETWRNIYGKVARKVFNRKKVRHFEPSIIYAPNEATPNDFLINLISQSANLAWTTEIEGVNLALPDSQYCNIYPGEHYRLMKAIAKILNPKTIVEIGTYTGMGARALMQGQTQGMVYTYDILPWTHFENHLTQQDFDDQKVVQILSDLSLKSEFEKNMALLNQAQIIFVDGPKDSKFEYQLLPLLQQLNPMENKLLILDDIRFVNMVDLWIGVRSPKLDVTSLGHWSGTGLVDISQPLVLT
jgi:predicted O-methyltransferase YrrM